MPFFDRFWWLRSLAALAVAAGTVALAVVIVGSAGSLGFGQRDDVARGALCVSLLGLLALILIGFQRGALRARARKRARLAVIRGPAPALVGKGVALLDEPLRLLWRLSWWQVAQTIWHELCLLVCLPILIALVVPFMDIESMVTGDLLGAWVASATWASDWQPAAALVLLAFVALRLWALTRHRGVVATNEGLIAYTAWRRRLIRWEDARLLEERELWASPSRVYTLYSLNGAARWFAGEKTPDGFLPVDASNATLQQRSERLQEYIQDRAGLAPLRIAAPPRVPTPPDPLLSGTTSYDYVVTFLAALFCCILFGMPMILGPLSSSETLNWLVGISLPLACIAAALPPCAAWLIATLRGPRAVTAAPADVSELSEPSGWAYEVRQGMRLRNRLALVLPGLALSVDALPALALWLPAKIASLFGVANAGISDQAAVVAYALFALGAGGLLVAFLAMRSRIHIYRADADGLTEFAGRRIKAHIPWSSMQRLASSQGQQVTWAYQAIGNNGRTRITWLAMPFGPHVQFPGRSTITPAQLFALAVKHSGVEPSESWQERNLRRLRDVRTHQAQRRT